MIELLKLIICHKIAMFFYGAVFGYFSKFRLAIKIEKWKIKNTKNEEREKWKEKYSKYKKKNGSSIEGFKELKKNSGGVLPRQIPIMEGCGHNYAELIYYGFVTKQDQSIVLLEDIFIDLLEDDLGGVDRY